MAHRAVLLSCVGVLASSAAWAGPLGKTVGGLNRASQGSNNSSSGGSSSPPDSSPPPTYHDGGPSYPHHHRTYVLYEPRPAYWFWGAPPPSYYAPGAPTMPIFVDGSIAAQKVDDSDGALRFDLAVSIGPMSLGGRWHHFWESASKDAMEGARLGLWDVHLGYRFVDDLQGSIAAEVGLGGATFTPAGITNTGLMVGVTAAFWVSRFIGLYGEARGYALGDDVSAGALGGGLQVSFIRLGYRIVDFNVGPPLKGPEVAAVFRF